MSRTASIPYLICVQQFITQCMQHLHSIQCMSVPTLVAAACLCLSFSPFPTKLSEQEIASRPYLGQSNVFSSQISDIHLHKYLFVLAIASSFSFAVISLKNGKVQKIGLTWKTWERPLHCLQLNWKWHSLVSDGKQVESMEIHSQKMEKMFSG